MSWGVGEEQRFQGWGDEGEMSLWCLWRQVGMPRRQLNVQMRVGSKVWVGGPHGKHQHNELLRTEEMILLRVVGGSFG